MNDRRINYEPRFIYVITYIDEYDQEYIDFSVSRDYIIEEIFKKPLKIFFLLEHSKTYGFYDANIPYYMVFSKCKFYPERLEMTFIPPQEWVPAGSPLPYLMFRGVEKKKVKVFPKLFFQVFSEFGFVYITVNKDEKSYILPEVRFYSKGKVECRRQKLERLK